MSSITKIFDFTQDGELVKSIRVKNGLHDFEAKETKETFQLESTPPGIDLRAKIENLPFSPLIKGKYIEYSNGFNMKYINLLRREYIKDQNNDKIFDLKL